MGKSIKKLVKKVTKVASKIPGIGFSSGSGGSGKAPEAEVPQTQMLAQADVKAEDATDESNAETDAAKKAAKRVGKQGLSVSRSGGTGVNL